MANIKVQMKSGQKNEEKRNEREKKITNTGHIMVIM